MRIIEPSVSIIDPPDYQRMLKHIEAAGRTCYKSEDKISDDSAERFIGNIISREHLSVCEHVGFSVRFICDRGVTHELVRHRLCSFSQESTRYCNYSGEKFGREVTFIRPVFWEENSREYKWWYSSVCNAEAVYLELIESEASPQEARSVLPNSTKTEIVVTTNLREWRLIFSQRCAKDAHPSIQQIMLPLLSYAATNYPVFFQDLKTQFADRYTWFETKNYFLPEVEVEQ